MRFDAGTTDIPTAGSRVQISTLTEGVLSLFLHARAVNGGIVYFGVSDVSATNGLELAAGATHTVTFSSANSPGSVPFRTFYLDAANNGDDVDWTVILS